MRQQQRERIIQNKKALLEEDWKKDKVRGRLRGVKSGHKAACAFLKGGPGKQRGKRKRKQKRNRKEHRLDGLNVSPPNSHVETLSPHVMVFGGGVWGAD